ncbi:MFS general substrate transporter [Rhizoctonia solani]|uniref:MFS general substrate transporter n=1 Tax=Rhizoctonia solani TaxID=456999 RepID=A0A8H7IBQ5_9AGAM|nr:MFS general substrate transporter [Rhizoctonia solani]
MSGSVDTEKKGSPISEPEVLSVERRTEDDSVDRIYDTKSELVNQCLQNEIGMGRYQWELFLLSGFGWMADNIWLQGVAIILPSIEREMQPEHIAFATLSLYVGLIVGATTWGILADIIGRRLSWNITLFLSGVFGIAAGGSHNFVTLGSLVACLGFGIGGNLPVDGALFLEFIPGSHQWLLTLLSAWWSFGQLTASLIAWGFISRYSCTNDTSQPCPVNENQGWRYTFYTLGAMTFLMFLARYAIFNLQESPKYLLAKVVIKKLLKRNSRTITLTLEQFQAVNDRYGSSEQLATSRTGAGAFVHALKGFDLSHVKPLFSTPTLALNTSLTIACWALIGLAYPLYNAFLPIYLNQRSVSQGSGTIDETYRNYSIVSVLGIPGSIIACIMVDWTRGSGKWSFGGRKFAMAISTCLTGVFLFLFTQAKNEAGVLGFNCASTLTQNAMYGVVFPAPHRGTGDAICSAINRITGLMAPIIATYGDLTSNAPLFVAASLFLVTSLLMLFLPIETAGKAAI